jgi:L-malate glycosyltransferase
VNLQATSDSLEMNETHGSAISGAQVYRPLSSEKHHSRPIRVLIVIKVLGWGGAERLLLEAARRHDNQRFELHVLAQMWVHQDYLDQLAAAGVEIHRPGYLPDERFSGLRMLKSMWSLARLFRNLRPDVVHVHSPLFGSVARLTAILMRSPARRITTEHNTWPAYHRLTQVLNRLTIRFDHSVICVSEETLESMRGRARRIARSVVHGIDTVGNSQRFADGIRRRSEIAPAPPIKMVNVGHLCDDKDQRNLLQALRILADNGISFSCQIVGDGYLKAELEALVCSLGLTCQVRMLGSQPEAIRFMNQSDVLVVSSKREGMPVVVMEALSIGLPIVSTTVGGIKEHLGMSEACSLCPPEDPQALAAQLCRMATIPTELTAMSVAALSEAKRFDSASFIREIENIYLN